MPYSKLYHFDKIQGTNPTKIDYQSLKFHTCGNSNWLGWATFIPNPDNVVLVFRAVVRVGAVGAIEKDYLAPTVFEEIYFNG